MMAHPSVLDISPSEAPLAATEDPLIHGKAYANILQELWKVAP